MRDGPQSATSDSLLTRPIPAGPGRLAVAELLVADGIRTATATRWCAGGEVFALVDLAADRSDAPLAAVVLEHGPTDTTTLLAVAPVRDGSQLVRRLLAQVIAVLRARGVRSLVAAGTAPAWRCQDCLPELGFRPTSEGGPVRLEL